LARFIGDDNLYCQTPRDLVLVSITIPAPGYIMLDGRFNATVMAGTAGGAIGGVVEIDESPGLTPSEDDVFFYTNLPPSGTLATVSWPVTIRRVIYKPAGTYTFRLKGYAGYANCGGVGYSVKAHHPTLMATYYPTSYGSVATLVSSNEVGQFDKSEAVSVPTGPDGKGPATTMYQVDLRELELKAARLRAETEKAERELAEAKMNEMRKQQDQTASDKK
jgi:hypothetical protein